MTPPDTAASLVPVLDAWLERLFPDPERGARLRADLAAAFGDDERPVSADVLREMEVVGHGTSRHLALEHVPDGGLTPDTDPPGWPPQDADEVRRRAGSVRDVARHDDGIGIVALDGLDAVHLAAPYVEAAFRLLRGTRGVVLDLRNNGGGDPGTVALVLDWLLGTTPTHVSDVRYRDRTRQWWTRGRPPELALPAGTPVVALIGPRTFSSGEALAYHLHSQGRVRLVGQRTPGAADHITPVVLTPHVRAHLPEAVVRDAVTGTNWEGAGVVPDVACEAGDTMRAGLQALRDAIGRDADA